MRSRRALRRQLGLHFGAQSQTTGQCRSVVNLHGLDLRQRKLRAAILTEQAHCICTALAAMAHHRHVAGTGILQVFQFLCCRAALPAETVVRAMFRLRDQRHHIVQERPLGLDDTGDFLQVFVIDTGDHHRIDLDQHATRHQHLQPLLLLRDENFGRRATAHAPMFPEDPRIDLGTDIRINAVDGDRHMLDVVLHQFIDTLGQGQPVGRYAQLDIRRLLGQFAESGESTRRIGQRIARPGNAKHRQLWDGRTHRQRLLHRLRRREHL